MFQLTWDSLSANEYQLGVDRGVLYPSLPSAPGVSWNGLISVDEDNVGGETNPYYHDGYKFIEAVMTSDFSATLQAYTYPPEFLPCMGQVEIVPGFSLTGQYKQRFGLSYRTLIGDIGYKLHIVYNVTATPSGSTFKTLGGSSADPVELEWKLDAVPPAAGGFVPTAHFVINSLEANSNPTDALKLVALENLLYGNASTAPALPPLAALLNMFKS
jgi:hypothetical protein